MPVYMIAVFSYEAFPHDETGCSTYATLAATPTDGVVRTIRGDRYTMELDDLGNWVRVCFLGVCMLCVCVLLQQCTVAGVGGEPVHLYPTQWA